jgi:two-component system alkaline phosphatase synthesis response regulator PhoP
MWLAKIQIQIKYNPIKLALMWLISEPGRPQVDPQNQRQTLKQNALIYVIEDEQDIAELVRFNLALQGYKVEAFLTGETGLAAVQKQKPDLIILDLMLPGLSGLEICKRLRNNGPHIPIIMVTAKGEEQDVVKGLEAGADDYVAKPFSPKVLIARVEAVLRRAQAPQKTESEVVEQAGLQINPGRFEVRINGEKVDLTRSEFSILHFLAQRPGWVYTRMQIVEAIRGENYAVTDRTIDFQMVGLRKKLGEMGSYIETVRGVGYRFKD